jgi:hypothetical protein
VVLLGILLPRRGRAPAREASPADAPSEGAATALARAHRPNRFAGSVPAPDAREIVAGKVSHFAHDRLGVVRAMARHFKIEVPPDVERFFAAAEAGRWDELKELFG